MPESRIRVRLRLRRQSVHGPEVRSTYPLVPAIQVVQGPANPELSGLSTMWLTGALSIICSVIIAPLNEMGAKCSPVVSLKSQAISSRQARDLLASEMTDDISERVFGKDNSRRRSQARRNGK
jgi:hypothetical protein